MSEQPLHGDPGDLGDPGDRGDELLDTLDDLDHPDDEADSQPAEPRIRVTKGSPWLITPERRAKWSAPDFVAANAVAVRQVGDPVLHAPGKRPKLSRPEMEGLVSRMFASMVAAHGIGIAAQQIGVPLRVVIIDADEVGVVAVNPEIEWVSEELIETSEGCLSVRGLYGMLDRPLRVRLVATDVGGKRFAAEGEDLGAQCMIHETEHTSGVLYVDRLRSRKDLFAVEPTGDDDHRSVSGHSRAEMEAAREAS